MAKNEQITPEVETTAEVQTASEAQTAPVVKKEKTVNLRIPRGGTREDPSVYIAVNGKNYLLPKGKESTVPKHIAEEYERSERAKDKYFETVNKRRGKGEPDKK